MDKSKAGKASNGFAIELRCRSDDAPWVLIEDICIDFTRRIQFWSRKIMEIDLVLDTIRIGGALYL